MPAQADSEWLHLRLAQTGRRLHPDLLHDFIERIGIKHDSGISEHDAREQAYKEMFV